MQVEPLVTIIFEDAETLQQHPEGGGTVGCLLRPVCSIAQRFFDVFQGNRRLAIRAWREPTRVLVTQKASDFLDIINFDTRTLHLHRQ